MEFPSGVCSTLMENNMMYFLGIPSEVSLLQVDPVTLQTVNSASPTIPNLANVNDLCAAIRLWDSLDRSFCVSHAQPFIQILD